MYAHSLPPGPITAMIHDVADRDLRAFGYLLKRVILLERHHNPCYEDPGRSWAQETWDSLCPGTRAYMLEVFAMALCRAAN